jgi:hypothetical protein
MFFGNRQTTDGQILSFGMPGFDFHKIGSIALLDPEVHFSKGREDIAIGDGIPLPLKPCGNKGLTSPAQALVHAIAVCKNDANLVVTLIGGLSRALVL